MRRFSHPLRDTFAILAVFLAGDMLLWAPLSVRERPPLAEQFAERDRFSDSGLRQIEGMTDPDTAIVVADELARRAREQ